MICLDDWSIDILYKLRSNRHSSINRYIDELLVMQHFIFYAQDGVMALLLWRGTVPCHLPFLDRTCMLPTHSMAAFVLSVLTVERPQLLPSVVFACIAWFMIATQEYRRSIPDVWSRCKSFRELAEILILGQSQTPPDSIKVGENSVAAKEYLDSWKKRIEDAEEAASKAYQEQLKSLEAYEREMEEIGDTGDLDIATKSSGGVSIDPFQTILFPVQQNLAMLCRYIRHVKHVASWQECYIAFWVTAGCFLLSFVCLFIPWFFIIQWVARVTVWTLFGPWMKLVDIYYVTKLKPLTEEEQRKKKYLEREKRDGRTQKALSDARLKREEQVKLKDMKKILFGKFITRVPVLKEDRYRDLPTAESHAKPHRPKPSPISELAMKDAGYNKKRMAGQHLIGDMIPKIELPSLTDAPVGQPTSYMSLVDKHRPGGSVLTGMESTVAAYIKLGTLVATAGVLTWFGVPILAAITQFLISYAQ